MTTSWRSWLPLLGVLACCVAKPASGPQELPLPDAGATRESDAAADPSHFVLRGGALPGGDGVDVEVADGRIVAVGDVAAGLTEVDVRGRFLVPAFIDSHVHLAYEPRGAELARNGVAGAVDLAAPIEFLAQSHTPLRLIAAGPMVTAVDGYPLESWGRDGYGLACPDRASALAAVEELVTRGAGVIKLPVTGPPGLDDAILASVVERAHARGLKVASHALSDAEARRAAAVGVDVLAHTPTEELSEATLEAWEGRAVIGTLAAFGGTARTLENLARLRARGLTVLYGTDFGNTRVAGIQRAELALLMSAGLDGAAIVAAGTSSPAEYWGFSELGKLEAGRAASLLVLASDPHDDPLTLAAPEAVYIDGVEQSRD